MNINNQILHVSILIKEFKVENVFDGSFDVTNVGVSLSEKILKSESQEPNYKIMILCQLLFSNIPYIMPKGLSVCNIIAHLRTSYVADTPRRILLLLATVINRNAPLC